MVHLISLTATALLCVVTVAADRDENYAYVRLNLTQYQCVSFPKTDLCPDLDIKVISIGLHGFVNALTQLNSLLPTLRKLGANDSCIDAVVQQQCLGIPRCIGDGQGQAVDSDAALAECQRGRSQCNSVISNIHFDCDKKAELYKNMTSMSNMASSGSCALIEDQTDFCPDVKYKRYNSSAYEYTNIFKGMKSNIEPLKGKTTVECYKKVKALTCSYLGACSDDGKLLLALYNQKDCNNTVDCLPESDRDVIKGFLCSDAPDADNPNVQKVSYPKGYEVPTTLGKAPHLKNTEFLLVVAVFFSYFGTL